MAVAFSSSGLQMASGGGGGSIFLWDTSVGFVSGLVEGVEPPSPPRRSAPDSPGRGEWYPQPEKNPSGALKSRLHEGGFGDVLYTMEFSPTDENQLVSTFNYGEVALWDVGKRKKIWSIREGGVFARFSPDGRTIATAMNSAEVHLIDAESGEMRLKMVHGESLSSAAFSGRDGSTIASGGTDGSCKVGPRQKPAVGS